METLFTRHRNWVALVAVLFVQVVLLGWQVKRRNSDVPLLREWVQEIMSPPQKAVSAVLHGTVYVWQNYFDLRGAREQNIALQEELNRQKIDNQLLREQAEEFRRLKTLQSFQEQSSLTTVTARVIGSGASDTSRVVFLNKGREDGLEPNHPVITPEGIVGKVQRVFRSSVQVLLISDSDSGVGVLLEKSRVHGVLKGQNGQYCQLRYVLNDEKVEVGDRVLTSGEDQIYPKGLPVGTVASAQPGPIFKEIIVQPAARLNRLEEVLVVLKAPETELAAKEASQPELPGPVRATSLPPAAANATPAQAEQAAPSSAPDRPGIPRGTRPETDADRIREEQRRRAAQQATKSQQAAPKPPAPAPAAPAPAPKPADPAPPPPPHD